MKADDVKIETTSQANVEDKAPPEAAAPSSDPVSPSTAADDEIVRAAEAKAAEALEAEVGALTLINFT